MEKIAKMAFLAFIMFSGIFLLGCPGEDGGDDGAGNETGMNETGVNETGMNETGENGAAVNGTEAGGDGPSDADFTSVANSNNQFAFDLYSKYGESGNNVFYSPYSITSALTMAYEGAEGQTAEEMREVFHLPENIGEVREGFYAINRELNKGEKPYTLSVANSLWAQEGYPFVEEYFDVIGEYYSGKATNLDFARETENARITINAWVEENTKGKICDIIPQGMLSPANRLVIANAVYFKANWSSQFSEYATANDTFTLETGEEVEVEMMHQMYLFNYAELDELEILEMPYQGNDISMLVILPKEGMEGEVEGSFTLENFEMWKESMEMERVEVGFPKFTYEANYMMANDLKDMGMPTAFSPDADFTGMSPTGELFIDEVIHKTYIEVTEAGTEAAAATVVMMRAVSIIEEPPKQFTADRPFIFIIQQKDSGNILFMGKLSDPSE